MADSDPSLEMRVFAQMVRVVHVVSQRGAVELRRQGVTAAQYQVLLLLRDGSNPSQHELGEALGVTKGNVSQMLSRLESRGLVVRVPHGATKELRLTEAGRVLIDRLVPDHRAFLRAQFGTLDEQQLGELEATLNRLATGL